jgi:hypothetical protein
VTRCRHPDCAAPIRWGITTAGKRMPVDVAPSPEGNLSLEETRGGRGPNIYALAGEELAEARAAGERLYLSHFATCAHAAEFRTRRQGK